MTNIDVGWPTLQPRINDKPVAYNTKYWDFAQFLTVYIKTIKKQTK